MDRLDAYARLYSLRESNAETRYYRDLLAKSDGDVPEEVVSFLEGSKEYGPALSPLTVDVETDFEDGVSDDQGEHHSDDTGLDIPPAFVETQDEDVEGDGGYVGAVVEPQIDVVDLDGDDPELGIDVILNELPAIEVEVEGDGEGSDTGPLSDIIAEVEIDPDEVISEFIENVRSKPVWRQLGNDGNPFVLSKAVNSFVMRYLIETGTSEYGPDVVKESVYGHIDVGDVLRLLASYVDDDDLEALAEAVVMVRDFLGYDVDDGEESGETTEDDVDTEVDGDGSGDAAVDAVITEE